MDQDVTEILRELGRNLESCGRMLGSKRNLTIEDLCILVNTLELNRTTLHSVVRTIHERNASSIAPV